jgi:hypothetical protein
MSVIVKGRYAKGLCGKLAKMACPSLTEKHDECIIFQVVMFL